MHKNEKGFVILFTVLISSIILAIALGISSIAYKEVVLSSAAKESQYSFFAADTGAECALYWDIQQNVFGATPNTPAVQCNGISPNFSSGSSSPFAFTLSLNNDESCAKVTIDKNVPADPLNPLSTATLTQIRSLGYNAPCAVVESGTLTGYEKIVERAIGIDYAN